MSTNNSDIADRTIQLLQAAGYEVHEGEAGDGPELGTSAFWFTYAPEIGDIEAGPTCTDEASAWLSAAEHFFDNASIPTYGIDDSTTASPGPKASSWLKPEELATILTALRCYQEVRAECGGDIPAHLQDIADDGGKLAPLDADQIDALCERLNLGGIEEWLRGLLERCESFIAGFEDDEDQEGIPELLAELRGVIGDKLRTAPDGPSEQTERRVFEVTAAGFDATTDETDDRVFWVEADSSEQVRTAIMDSGATLCGPVTADAATEAVDFRLPTEVLNLSAELLRWVSIERNKSRAC